jgi:hypothetical protein
MALQSQRFKGDATLESCVNGYRMTFNDPNADSVRKVQFALLDLGYPMRRAGDGLFGEETCDAVAAFKTDEGLSPNNPVVGPGTMTRLDEYFAGEADDPDAPDASAAALVPVAESAMATAVGWITAAIDKLNQWPAGEQHPEDPDWVVFDEALERNLHVGTATAGRETALEEVVLPVFHAAKRALAQPSPFLVLQALDQATFRSTFPNSRYFALRLSPGAVATVTPPFRNAMSAEAQAGSMTRVGVSLGHHDARPLGFPGMPRYAGLTGDDALANNVAYASFAFEVATGIGATFVPAPAWA